MHIADFYKEVLGVGDEMAAQMTAISHLETVPRGHRIISMGEQAEMLPVLVKGTLRGFVVDENGRDITDCFISQKGDIIMGCGEVGAPSPVHIEALETCQLLMLPLCDLLPLMNTFELLMAYNRQLADALKRHWQLKMLLYQCDAMARYRWFLETYPGLEDLISGKHLASYLAMTPVTLSRLRRKLREEN